MMIRILNISSVFFLRSWRRRLWRLEAECAAGRKAARIFFGPDKPDRSRFSRV